MEILRPQYRAPEVYGDYWFNSDPIPIGALRGFVILIDFWDYTSINCLRTLPYMKEWYRRYREMGLVMIGVHTPEFPFARNPLNVREAIEKLGIKYPIVMDNDFIVWGAYHCHTWPTKYLIDKNGFIRYIQPAEGSYQNFEHCIQSLLTEAGYHADFPLVMDPIRESDRPGAPSYRTTQEILAGWQRGTLGNIEGYSPEGTTHYEDPSIYLDGRLYLNGNWLNDKNFLKLNEPDYKEGYIVITYEAKEVNAVIEPEGEKNFQVFVTHDDGYIDPLDKGDDIRFDEQGRSYFIVDSVRLYNIIKNREYSKHKLKLSTRSNGFALYSISFGSCAIMKSASAN